MLWLRSDRQRETAVFACQSAIRASPDVGNARGVVRVEMGQEQCVDSTDRYADLEQPDGRPSPRIDQQFLLAGLDEGAWPEAIRTRRGYARAEQCDAEIIRAH